MKAADVYIKLQTALQLHLAEESEAADDYVRDAMDDLWFAMSDAERNRARDVGEKNEIKIANGELL